VTTTNRDFKVKHGLNVALGGTFGQAVTVGTPTENTHAATKLYVDTKAPVASPGATSPATPVDGQLWFDTVSRHLSVYSTDQAEWIMIATFADTADLRQHIHDTAIDGTGLIVSVFQDAGFYDSIFTSTEIAGFYDSEYWTNSYDGGSPLDNFS
jgi:hypothetical protein